MKKVIFGALVAMVLAACVKDDVSIAKVEEAKNPYAVTPDEAVQLLKTVIGGESTRAVSVGEIKTLRKSDFVPTTRGGEDGDVIYIVDLEDGGSAVMGADKRMEPIYAILDETKISPEELAITTTRSTELSSGIEDFVVGALNGAIQIDLMSLGDPLPEMPLIPRDEFVTVTTTLSSKAPLLDTKWGWVAPYSNLVGGVSIDNGITALAQLFYYYRQPSSIGSYNFDWDLISECEYGQTPSSAAQTEVAEFVYAIAQNSNTPFAFEEYDIYQAMIVSGYTPSSFIHTDDDNIADLIKSNSDLNRLVFAKGTASNNTTKYWLSDGYKFYREDIYLRQYDPSGSGLYNDTFQSSSTHKLCHCNFGYQGVCDGYYKATVLDLTARLTLKNISFSSGDVLGTQGYSIETTSVKYATINQ